MAAMGIVDDNVDENSGLSPDLAAGGSWYGTTVFRTSSALSHFIEIRIVRDPSPSRRPQPCDAMRCGALMRHGMG